MFEKEKDDRLGELFGIGEVCLKGISSGEENSRTVMGPKYRRIHIYQKGVEIPTMQLSRLHATRLECLLQLLQSETAAVLLTETLTLFRMKMNGRSMVMETSGKLSA